MYGPQYTEIVDITRHHKYGVQGVIRHGRSGRPTSQARAKAQMLWFKTRLIERGDDSARDLYTYDVRTRRNETQVSLAADVHTW